MSLINNVSSQVFERVLIDRFPNGGSWCGRSGGSSAARSRRSWRITCRHSTTRQAAANQAAAQQMGFR
jgi:hypothetical protein